MNSKIHFLFYLVVLTSCKSTLNQGNKKPYSTSETDRDSSTITIGYTGANKDGSTRNQESKFNTKDWDVTEFIVKCPKNYEEELKQSIEYQREMWGDVANPFIATYKGNDFGDYHHINFEDARQKNYDFGFGNNDFGSFKLFYDDDQITDNPKYIGMLFKVFWDWKISSFPCCSGDYEIVEAYVPSIVSLELVEK